MTIIRQGSLFSIQDLFDLEPTQRFEAVFSTIDMDSAVLAVSKKSWLDAPTELNYAAMVCSLVARLIELIPTVKNLVKRLKHDFIFRLECGFLVSDQIPSEASYSRLVEKLSESNVFEKEKESILLQAIEEGFIDDENASHFEARDQAPAKEKKPKLEPKKRGRKKKEEKEQYDRQKREEELNKTLNEKTIATSLMYPLKNFNTKCRSSLPGESRKTAKARTSFGMDTRHIWQLERRANIFFIPS